MGWLLEWRVWLRMLLGEGWRRAVGAHWTERARLAFAPGLALIILAAVLPRVVALVGGVGLDVLASVNNSPRLSFGVPIAIATAGVLTARYRFVRELWGPRVTLRSWSAGCLVLLFALAPQILVWAVLLFTFPETPSTRGAVMMAAAVAANLFFCAGGGIWILRLAGLIRTARPELSESVRELALEMKVPGQVKVFELEWAQVNAVAWQKYRAVGFSQALLQALSPNEVRAVAAHELGHLLEPEWVRAVRLAYTFALFPLVPLFRWGGFAGICGAWVLFVAITMLYKRFSRKMEARADRIESETIRDKETYMQSLLKLHEANLAPAVMPGSQTHPHLYDRLLAQGITPDFNRPSPPSRLKPAIAAGIAVVLSGVVMFGIVIAAALAARAGLWDFGAHG
jgi:Zn-dependent protease with chaperone function